MEGDGPGDNEKELTSTSSSEMGKHLSTNKEEKTDSNDTLPTSSTDASTSIKSSHPVTDDPISSTSSEMDPASKLKSVDILLTDNVDNTSTNFDTEAELLGISISSQSTEKIEENVEDLVNDLETLLGESTDSFNIPSKSIRITEPKTEVTSAVVEETTIVEPQLENEVSSNTSEKTIPEKSLDSECQSDILQENVADQIDETSSQLTEPSPSLGDSKESKPNDFESSEIHVNLKVPEPPNEETISQANLKADENLQGSEEVEIHEKVVTLENEKETTEYVDEVKDDRVLDEEKNNEIIINDKEQVLNKEIRIENTINIEQLNLQATSPKEDQQSSSLEQHERVIGETKNTEEVDDMAYKFSLPDESMDSLDIKLSEQCKGPPVSVPVVEESPDNQMDNIVDSSTTAPTISQENDKTSESTIAKKLEDSVPISEENEELEKSVSDHEKPEIDRIEISELSEAVMLESAEVDSIDPIVEEPKDHPETVEMDTQKMENEEKIDEIIEEETSKEDKSSAISSVSEIPEQVEASLPVVVNLKEEELNEPIIEEEKVQSELIVEECQKVIDEGKADVKLERLDEEKKKNQENVPDVVDVKEPDVEDSKENLLISEPLITDNEKLTETESSQQSSCCIEESQKSSIELKDAELNSNEQTKPPPEINIRRKTVEQDLEKVVCLSEESSSDSDTHNVPKEVSDETVSSDEVDLIKIAEQVDRFPEVEESLPEIETVLPLSAAASSNLETMIAVASLQTESVTNTPEERKLSEKEIRDMEAIRMAVASITDSSEDTYDSFMIDNTVAMDSCSVQENQEPFENSTPSQNVFEIDFQQKSQVEKENKVIEEAKSECTIDKVTEPAKEGESLNKITEIKDTIIDKFEEVKENILVQEERSELILNQVVLTKPEIIEEEKPDLIQSKNDSISAPAPDVKQTSEDRPTKTRTKRIKVSEPLSISIEDVDKKEKIYSPKITIKPVKPPDEEVTTTSEAEANKGSLKMTITKQSDNTHSILKVYSPDDDASLNQVQEEPIPKLIIKPKIQQVEQQQHSPKMSTRSSKAYSPTTSRCSSPRITIKPVTKPVESKAETTLSPIKITFKPVVKPEEGVKKHSPKLPNEKNHNPKITIKPIPKPSEVEKDESHTPKVTIRPLKRPQEEGESDNEQGRSSPKITIKPVIKSVENDSEQAGPKLKIKPIKKHDDEERSEFEKEQDSPKVSIKPIEKSVEVPDEEGDEVKGRIILKINKGNLPTPNKESRKREYVEEEKSEKVAIKLKFSTTGGHTHIIQEGEEIANKRQKKDLVYSNNAAKSIEEPHKRQLEEKLSEKNKRIRNVTSPDKFNENISEVTNVNQSNPANENSRPHHSAELNPSWHHTQKPDISKIADLAAQTTHIGATPILTVGVATPSVVTPTPKRRGRPRKVPLQVREELKDPVPMTSSPLSSNLGSDIGTPEASPSPGGRPKRSCRGQNVIATLGIKPRKPRGRGRGSKVNMGDREPPLVQPIRLEPVEIVPVQPEKVKNKSKKQKRKSHRRSKSK
ncbi:hypothetical protein ABEB36_004095 [Hypothenemus hampei]|uniref:PHD finger protein 10 n=1 Tax=Hypothenemus hampei TaxID=57062 RepID=A0ABD1F260_HYPHA